MSRNISSGFLRQDNGYQLGVHELRRKDLHTTFSGLVICNIFKDRTFSELSFLITPFWFEKHICLDQM